MRFAHPGLLLLIPVLIAMIGGVWVLEKRRNRRRIAPCEPRNAEGSPRRSFNISSRPR